MSVHTCHVLQPMLTNRARGNRDTVASVGLVPQYLPFVSENNGIRVLRHALSLDERRIKFLPNFAVDPRKKKAKADAVASVSAAANGAQTDGAKTNGTKSSGHKGGKRIERTESAAKAFEDMVNSSEQTETDALEVWFAGVHAGTYPSPLSSLVVLSQLSPHPHISLAQTSSVAQ